MEKKVLFCEFNMDTGCVEVKYADGSMIAINCTKVENEVARNMYEVSELDWLVYNAPMDYVNLLLHGDIREYLKNVTEYRPFDNCMKSGVVHPGSTAFFYLNGKNQSWIIQFGEIQDWVYHIRVNQYWEIPHN